MVYLCSGTDSEKLDWFKTINIAGEKLTDQELRNAVYAGPWVTDAKRYFSKTGCPAYGIGSDYMTGTPIRQDYLETVDQVDQRRRHRGVHGHAPARPERQRAVALLPERHRLGEGDLPEVPQGDEGRRVGRALQRVQGRRAGPGEA